ncbi:CDP-glycerol glycerophosphotransferase family protein [Virgibacillus sp. FSP13]
MKLFALFNKRKKKQKKKLKYNLDINQNKDNLKLTGSLSKESYTVSELWLFSREERKGHKVDESNHSTNEFEFNVSLDKLLAKLENESENESQNIFDWYIKVIAPYSELAEAKKEDDNVKLIEKDDELTAEYYLRFGRFQHTQINELSFYYKEDDYLINYLTQKGNLSVTVNNEPDSPTRIQVEKVKSQKSKLKIEGKIFTRNSLVKNADLVLKGRDTSLELNTANTAFYHVKEMAEKRYGLNRYTYSAEVDLATINNGKLPEEDVYDLFFKLDLHDKFDAKYVRIGRPTFRARFLLKDIYAKDKAEAIVINPYFTFKMSNLSLESYKFPIETYNYLRKTMRWAWLLRLLNRNRDIWIVGERSYKAQDTGLAFFKYMRTNHPTKEVYYVIDHDSPEKANVEHLGNVLDFKSKEHIRKAIIAKKVISSHHPEYLYPINTPKFKSKVKADKVFLQHGVMGTKNMVANYGKKASSFNTDLFMVSSDFEKEMIINDFGYDPEQVFVTGLSRFDTLFENDVEKKRQILIIPTWRDWIVTDEAFFESAYYERYKQLINNHELHDLAKKYDAEILFCLHPNMQKFSKYFENSSVKVINQGEVDVQHLIKESALMITDYSSVGFDFSFLHKPVIYYQFDRSKFIGKRPSHLDLDNDLPGEICVEQDQVLKLVEEYAHNDFRMKDEYKLRANKFIKYRDQLSSERIWNVINKTRVDRNLFDNPKIELLLQALFTKYRKSKYYFPSMKLFYKIGSKVIPVDNKLILFESGLGKQYGDSPRKIYEEVLKRDLDYKKVWVYNKRQRFKDPQTKRIKRLSPQYYYYLIRARYWVNNQNFPAYIRKRPKTTYLQTWHGTPLKKMLYDIEEVHGRSDDYVERIGEAVKNWDYLISPSEYATKAFRSAFQYNGEVLEVGYPRNDIFYKAEKHKIARKVKSQLGIDNGKKVILYAPTFRDDQAQKKNKFSFDINMDLHKMKEMLGDEYIVLLRMHVVISNNLQLDESLEDFVYNVSNYSDIQELQLVTDILITDYSSVMFDFANTGKPMLFYTFDLEHYRDDIRGFYMDLEDEAPGPLVYDTDQIIENVLNIDKVQNDYQQKYTDFQHKYCLLEDGNASKRVVDELF